MANFPLRRATADTSVSYTDAEGSTHTIHADADGVLKPNDPAAAAALDSLGFPNAHVEPKAKSASKRRSTKRDNKAVAAKSAATRKANREARERAANEAREVGAPPIETEGSNDASE